MYSEMKQKTEPYIKRGRSRSIWQKIVQMMACIVVFCTTYALILPAITVEQTYYCGIEDHEHTENCKIDTTADVETEEIWESTFSHVTLTGERAEDLVSIAQTQIGYAESNLNYLIEDGEEPKGYTRYGEWSGAPYGDWDARFVSFCLNYANISEEVILQETDAVSWFESLQNDGRIKDISQSIPSKGDIVFVNNSPGIISSIEIEEEKLIGFQVIQGDYHNEVVQRYVDISSETVNGYCSISTSEILEEELQTAEEVVVEGEYQEEAILMMNGGIATIAETANVNLNFTSWSQYNAINFPQGNDYTCAVGSTITIIVSDSQANYYEPQLTVSGGEVVSVNYTCETAGCSHGWCPTNPVHTIVVKATSSDVTITASIMGANWSNNSVTIDESGSGDSGGESGGESTEPEVPEEPPLPNVPTYPYYPDGVHTGRVHIERLRFYNLCENGDNGVSALAGCVFEVVGDNGYKTTVVSGDDPEVHLPEGIPDGTYTITEISTPSGYMRDTDYQRTFAIKDGVLVSDKNIGTFINHDLEQLATEKTAEVENYNNRIYQVLISAESHMRMYQMDPIDVLFVVDQSNSMLFPSGLEETGKSVTLTLSGNNNVNNIEALNLDKNEMYYIISDPAGTSTVWALWYNGQNWIYQDASYYAKAKQDNTAGYQDPNEKAIFPENRSYQDQKATEASGTRSNGGGIGYSLAGSGLGKYIDTQSNDVHTFQIYTATGEYNRLHYLEEALANMIYELADVNSKNRVTLTEFTKEVDEVNDCMGPLELTPENADALVAEVRSINTSGGTRQDIALKHVYENHLNDSSKGYSGNPSDTYTILITDGAPVLSSGSEIDKLGSPSDAASTTENSVYAQIKGYAQLVRNKSTMMTVGLGMDDVEAGKDVLEQIASTDAFFCALDDAAELVKSMQRLLFDAFRPKETIHVSGDVVDEISNSFYPIAWVDSRFGTSTGRQVLVNDGTREWILLEEGDWITLEGKYTTEGAVDAVGQLLQKSDGTFYIRWINQQFSDTNVDEMERIAWVAAGKGSSTRRTVVKSDGTKDWILLNTGDWISQEGEYYSGTPGYWSQRYYGQVAESKGDYYIAWGNSANGNNRQYYTSSPWKGTFYVKAKEDFVGGNAIETNKTAKVIVDGAEKYLDDPTVNVHLLDFNEMSSEVTVYLGDLVNAAGNSPLDSLQYFYEHTEFTKLIADGTDVLNKVSAESAEGLEEDTFTLGYAMGRDLTEAEWQRLVNGDSITVDYTYDAQSSKGPVGYFTFQLEKIGIAGTNPAYEEHEAMAACQPRGQPLTEDCTNPAEIYTLRITYTAYKLGEKSRPPTNVFNGDGSPGTEVGTGTTLETGLGVIVKENVHKVHVISGEIEITKKFEDGLIAEEDVGFSFILHRIEDGEDTSKDEIKTIVIPAGSTQGAGTVTFDNLRRGTYTVTEADNDSYVVKEIKVLDSTNCYSTPAIGETAEEVTFVMGNNIGNNNVIGRYAEEERYTSYIDPVNGVYGATEFTNKTLIYEGKIPVEKIWDDGVESHVSDEVFVVLYKDDRAVLDSDGRARILKLNDSTEWKGSFKVVLTDKDDKISNHRYSVREVSQVSDESLHDWREAVLENDDTTVLYYEEALDGGKLLGVNGRGYMVQYEEGENSAQIVKNYRAFELPKTGGMGTHRYTISGLLMISIAGLMYGCSQRYKGERRRK